MRMGVLYSNESISWLFFSNFFLFFRIQVHYLYVRLEEES